MAGLPVAERMVGITVSIPFPDSTAQDFLYIALLEAGRYKAVLVPDAVLPSVCKIVFPDRKRTFRILVNGRIRDFRRRYTHGLRKAQQPRQTKCNDFHILFHLNSFLFSKNLDFQDHSRSSRQISPLNTEAIRNHANVFTPV